MYDVCTVCTAIVNLKLTGCVYISIAGIFRYQAVKAYFRDLVCSEHVIIVAYCPWLLFDNAHALYNIMLFIIFVSLYTLNLNPYFKFESPTLNLNPHFYPFFRY